MVDDNTVVAGDECTCAFLPKISVYSCWMAILFIALSACGPPEPTWREKAWVEPCHDKSRLLASTIGSPGDFECPNQKHKMRVEVMTAPSNEEFGALVFCECVTDELDGE